tara:strand:- start:1065 stop:1379 length:315 start_codon:yes stop_codon:yes gene_type:complete
MEKIRKFIKSMKALILLITFFLYGCCCPICGPTIYYSPNGKAFPTWWGSPPEIETKDYRLLPHGYGHGSSTLYHWIEKNKKEDQEKDLSRRLNNLQVPLSQLHQ